MRSNASDRAAWTGFRDLPGLGATDNQRSFGVVAGPFRRGTSSGLLHRPAGIGECVLTAWRNAQSAMKASNCGSAARRSSPTSAGEGMLISASTLRWRGNFTFAVTSCARNRSRTAARMTPRTLLNRVRIVDGSRGFSCISLTQASMCDGFKSWKAASRKAAEFRLF